MEIITQNIPYDNQQDLSIATNNFTTISSINSDHLKNNTKEKKKKNKKKKKKYSMSIDGDNCEISDYLYDLCCQSQNEEQDSVPAQLILDTQLNSGFFIGIKNGYDSNKYVGIPQGMEGNILIVGGNGSGKSAYIAQPTMRTWKGTMCLTDIKGELSKRYVRWYEQGIVTRPFIIFAPLQEDGIGYDPFYWVAEDDVENLVKNIWEITIAIIPNTHADIDPFWRESEQAILAAALLYYFEIGLSFSQAITMIMTSSVTSLYKKLGAIKNETLKMILGQGADMKPETLASIDRGLRNKLMLFAADPYISNAFRGQREGASCFTWDDLDHCNIFLRIPEERIEQWSGAVNLMYAQLIRHLERRPDKYSSDGANNVQTLLLMDEFASFGKLEMITSAVSTLRSKSVNICLMVQSMAQLDMIYGEYARRVIFDNCQYKAILRASDAETQKYLSDLIGTRKSIQQSVSTNYDELGECIGYGKQKSEFRELMIYPHELAILEDILFLTPYGFCRVENIQLHNSIQEQLLSHVQSVVQTKRIPVLQGVASSINESDLNDLKSNSRIIQGISITLEEADKIKEG